MTKPNKEDIKKVMSYLGKRSLKTMTPEERKKRGRTGALARLCFKCQKQMKVRYLHKGHYYCEKCNSSLSTG